MAGSQICEFIATALIAIPDVFPLWFEVAQDWPGALSTKMNYHLRLMEEPPMPPADADFSFKIEFAKATGNPRRIFDAASALIDAFEVLDGALVESIEFFRD